MASIPGPLHPHVEFRSNEAPLGDMRGFLMAVRPGARVRLRRRERGAGGGMGPDRGCDGLPGAQINGFGVVVSVFEACGIGLRSRLWIAWHIPLRHSVGSEFFISLFVAQPCTTAVFATRST